MYTTIALASVVIPEHTHYLLSNSSMHQNSEHISFMESVHEQQAGRGSSNGCASTWYADGRGFDPHIRQHSFVEIGHEKVSTAILSLPLIQEGQFSVTGKMVCTKYW